MPPPNQDSASALTVFMELPNGPGMPETKMMFVAFVSRPLKVWHRASNIQETNAPLSLESVDTPFICNAFPNGFPVVKMIVPTVAPIGSLEVPRINDDPKVPNTIP
jgi:hypothetical protein